MKRTPGMALASLVLAAAGTAVAATSQAIAQTGSIEFVARATPTGGRPEPVRQLTFYLLRKSFADTQKEVEETEPKPGLDRFIESLNVSKELKAWMKKQHSVELAGSDFIRRLTVNDVLDVPEFYDAYLNHNAGGVTVGFPSPRYRQSDREQNPQRYEKQRQEYREAVRKFIENNSQSVDGIDAHLEAINPGPRWTQQESAQQRRIRKRTLELAQTRYLVAKTDSDLDGRGALVGIPPGEYWLGTLETEAIAGDTRLRWDTPVTVRAGQATRLELSNLNSLP